MANSATALHAAEDARKQYGRGILFPFLLDYVNMLLHLDIICFNSVTIGEKAYDKYRQDDYRITGRADVI